jgi:serine/threonine protein kinase
MAKISFKHQDTLKKNTGVLRDYYRIGKVLGNGAFGEVRLCMNRETQMYRAVKILRKSHMDKTETELFFQEV